ncbi:MAG: hypothetical protein Q4B40_07545, partial [Clostridia bacterium]|nr:hypothetical protein [Clostridia bacterium]
GNRTELVALVNDLYKHIAAGDDVSYDSIREMSAPIVDWLQKNAVQTAERSEYANEVLKEIKSYKLSFSDSQKAEAAFGFDGKFNNYRKKNLGRFTISENGLPLDIAWQELSDMYPELFDVDITSTDQPIKLMEIVDNLQNENINDYDFWQDDFFKQSLFEKIYDEYWNVSTLHTFADRKQKEINILKSNHRKAVENIRRARDEKINDLKYEQRERVGRLREEYRTREQKKVRDVAERYRQSRKAAVESRNKTEEKNRLRKTIAEINSLLNHGSKEKNVKIAMQDVANSALKLGTVLFNKEISNRDIVNFFMMEQFAVTVKEKAALIRYSALLKELEMCQNDIDDLTKLVHNMERSKKIEYNIRKMKSIIFQLKKLDKELKNVFVRERAMVNNTKITDAVDELLKAYTALQKSDQPHIAGAYNDFVAGRIKAIAGLDNGVSEYAGMVVGDMSVLQLRELGDAYRAVLHTIKTSNELFKSNKSATVQELSELTLNEINGMAKKGIKAERNRVEKFSSKYLFNSLKPYYAFSKIGSDTLMHLYKELQKGESVVGTDLAE